MSLNAHDLIPFISLGVITFLIGIGLVINGLAFTIPRKTLADRSDDARAQRSSKRKCRMPQGPINFRLVLKSRTICKTP